MTKSIKFNEKFINVTKTNIFVINTFREIINSEGLSNVGISQDHLDTPGIMAKCERFLAQFFEEDKTNGTRIRLSPLEINLQNSGYRTYSAYEQEMNNVLDSSSIKLAAANTEAGKIEDVIVLSREILLRCVATALSNDFSADKDCHGFIRVISKFAVVLTNSWDKIGNIGPNLRVEFSTFLAKHNRWWCEVLNSIVVVQSNMQKHLEIINSAQESIQIRKKVIMAHAYVLTKKGLPINPADIQQNWIMHNFVKGINEKVTEICKNDPSRIVKITNTDANTEMLDLNTMLDNNTRVAAILYKHFTDINAGRTANCINQLFVFLRKAETLNVVNNKLEDMIRAVGWTMIVTGSLNFDNLQKKIDEFFTESGELITYLSDNVYKHSAKLQLAMNKVDIGDIAQRDITYNYVQLSDGSPLLEKIRNMCIEALTGLLECNNYNIPVLSDNGMRRVLALRERNQNVRSITQQNATFFTRQEINIDDVFLETFGVYRNLLSTNESEGGINSMAIAELERKDPGFKSKVIKCLSEYTKAYIESDEKDSTLLKQASTMALDLYPNCRYVISLYNEAIKALAQVLQNQLPISGPNNQVVVDGRAALSSSP